MEAEDDKKLYDSFLQHIHAIIISIVLFICLIGVSFYAVNQHYAKLLKSADNNYDKLEVLMNTRYKTVPKLVKATQSQMLDDEAIFVGISTTQISYKHAHTPIKKMEANTQIDQEIGSLISSINIKHPKMAKTKKVKYLLVKLTNSDSQISNQQLKYKSSVDRYNKALENPATFIFTHLLGYKPIDNSIVMS